MRLDRGFVNWGLFFIVLGAVPLAVQQGLIDRDLAARAWQLWPLLIVAAGVGLLLRRTSAEFLGGLIVAVTIGTMLGGLLAAGAEIGDIAGACGSGEGQPFEARNGTLSDPGRVHLSMNCGDVNVITAGGTTWSLSGSTDDGQPPDIEQDDGRLTIESRDRGGVFLFAGRAREAWNLGLPTEPTLALEVDLNAGSGQFGLTNARYGALVFDANAGSIRTDLTGSSLSELQVQVNAGSARLILPSHSFTGRLEANAGSIDFCVPDGVGLRITTNDNITGGNNFDERGLTRSGDTWETADYASATTKIELTANANAGSVNLNPEGGCR